jgi:Fic family protein
MPKLDAQDEQVLGELQEMRQDLQLHLRSKPRWEGQLRRNLFAAAIQGSNTIEKIIVSDSDARALVEGAPMSAETAEQTQAAVIGYRDAMTYVQQAPTLEFFGYTETLLSTLHFMITKYQPKKWPGRYRTGGIYVTGEDPLFPGSIIPAYTGPDPDVVPGLMKELVDWLEGGDLDAPSYARAALAHLNLVSIHPWRDGNGRMSRCVHTLILALGGEVAPEFSSIEEWLGRQVNTARYYDALQRRGRTFVPETDVHDWIRFVFTAHHYQAQGVRARVMWTERIWEDMERLVRRRKMPERMVSALYAAAVGEVRRVTYQQDENLTRDQAIRDIQALTRAGLLKPKGNATTRVYLLDGDGLEAREDTTNAVRAHAKDPYRAA